MLDRQVPSEEFDLRDPEQMARSRKEGKEWDEFRVARDAGQKEALGTYEEWREARGLGDMWMGPWYMHWVGEKGEDTQAKGVQGESEIIGDKAGPDDKEKA